MSLGLDSSGLLCARPQAALEEQGLCMGSVGVLQSNLCIATAYIMESLLATQKEIRGWIKCLKYILI